MPEFNIPRGRPGFDARTSDEALNLYIASSPRGDGRLLQGIYYAAFIVVGYVCAAIGIGTADSLVEYIAPAGFLLLGFYCSRRLARLASTRSES